MWNSQNLATIFTTWIRVLVKSRSVQRSATHAAPEEEKWRLDGPNCKLLERTLAVSSSTSSSRTSRTREERKEIERIEWNSLGSVRMKILPARLRTCDWFKGHAFPRFYSRVRRSSLVPFPEYLTSSTFPAKSFSRSPVRCCPNVHRVDPRLSSSLSFRVRLSPPAGAMLITTS